MKVLTCRVLSSILTDELDGQITRELHRGYRRPRSESGDADAPWSCGRCGTTLARNFERDGHYSRGLQTTCGTLDEVPVPMVECKCCGGSADIEFAAVPKHTRFWADVDEQVLLGYGFNDGLRQIAERVGEELGTSIGPATSQRRMHAAGEALTAWRQRPVEPTFDVLMIDGI